MAGLDALGATGSTGFRVSIVTPLYGANGGIALHVAASAAALRSAGHSVAVVCANSVGEAEGVTVVPGLDGPMTTPLATSFVSALRADRPDVIHIHDLADRGVVEAARRVAPTVITAHAYPGCTHNNHYFAPGEECHRAHGPGCLANIAFRGCLHARNPLPVPGMYRRTTRRMAGYGIADALVAHSDAVAQHLGENGLTARLVPMFTPFANIAAAPPAQRGGILFVGRIVPAKGLGVLLQAMATVDAELTVVGDGWWRTAAEQRSRKLGLTSRVSFEGWLDSDQVGDAYRRAAVVAVPSVWPEPFGLVGLEAMAFRLPVVASLTGGVGEWLADGVTGLAVPPGKARPLAAALNRLIDDRDLRDAMGAAGRAAVELDFTAERHTRALESVYEGVSRSTMAAAKKWRLSTRSSAVTGSNG